ncbi:MAG: TlpA family protein disulfide reductase [Pseudomonadales bacterium]
MRIYPKRLLLVLFLAMCGNAHAVTAGDQAPAWAGNDLRDGTQVSFPEVLDGRPAVLLFWATWCPYCKAFMPYAKQIHADYAESGLQVLTFNTKERGRGDPKAYMASLDFPVVAIADADGIAQQYDVQFIPGLMVVDGSGQVVYRRASTNLPAGSTVAQQWSNEVRAAVEKLLAVTPSAPVLGSGR